MRPASARSTVVGPASRSRACSTSPTTTLGPSVARPADGSMRPSSTSSSVVLPEPLAPTSATRSPVPTTRSIGPEREVATFDDDAVEAGDDIAGAAGRGDRQAQLPRLARLVDDVEALHRPLRAGRPAGELLGLVDPERADVLVRLVVRRPLDLGQALLRPLPLALRPAGERAPLGVVLLEPLPRRPPRRLPLVEVGLPAAAEDRGAVGELVDLEDVGDGPGEERAVVADEHDGRLQLGDPPLEALQPGEVEVVGRLVEQEHVEPGQQQRRQPGPRRLAAGQRGGRLGQQAAGEPEVGPHLPDAGIEIGAAEGQPPLEGDGVAVVGARRAGGEGGRRRVELGVGIGDAGAAGEERVHRLVRARRLLGQVADGGRRRRALDATALERHEPGEGLQQRRLADAVGADDADPLAAGDDERRRRRGRRAGRA